MNKEKTAMQMLIEAMQKDYDSIDDTANFALHAKKSEIGVRILQAKHLLQKEQEQIEKAFDDGQDYYNSNMNDRDYYKSKHGSEDVDR